MEGGLLRQRLLVCILAVAGVSMNEGRSLIFAACLRSMYLSISSFIRTVSSIHSSSKVSIGNSSQPLTPWLKPGACAAGFGQANKIFVWEPFGGLFSASLAAKQAGRKAFAGEIDPTYFQIGLSRFFETGKEKPSSCKTHPIYQGSLSGKIWAP